METRIKWLNSPQIGADEIKAFADAVRKQPFTKGSSRGFIPSEIRPRSVSGRFIERIEGSRRFTDPFGVVFDVPFVSYEAITFRIAASYPHIELVNSPRSTKRLFSIVDSCCKDSFTIEPAAADLDRWLDAIGDVLGPATVEEFRCDDIAVDSGLAADMTFAGSGDILASARKFLGKRIREMVYAKVSFDLGNRKLRATLFSSGVAKLYSEYDDGIVATLRGCLGQTITPSERSQSGRT
jgi:hypothetical protein